LYIRASSAEPVAPHGSGFRIQAVCEDDFP
jgi:hypothetical protein